MTYMTRQQREVLRCLEECPGGAGAVELADRLHAQGSSVGLTTVYRQLERLEQQGLVHKAVTDQGACYRFCDGSHAGRDCFLLKCERCGALTHVDCEHLAPLYRHLEEEHGFTVDPRRTMLYGVCTACREAENA